MSSVVNTRGGSDEKDHLHNSKPSAPFKGGPPVRVALYARVSTRNHGQDTEVQLRELRQYCQRQGWEIVGEYTDRITGTKARRPGLDKLMADAANHVFDVVLVWRWSRLARSVKHLHDALEKFNHLDIRFVSMNEGTDTSTSLGKLLFTILGGIAEFERDIVVENIRSGLENARSKGKHLGRPKGPDPRYAVDLDAVSRRNLAGESLHRISQDLGVSVGLLHKRLHAKVRG